MRAFRFILVLLAFPPAGCRSNPSGGSDKADGEVLQLRMRIAELRVQEQMLAAEFALARKPAPYLLVDLRKRTIALKARGKVLRGFGVRDVNKSGHSDAPGIPWEMREKNPLQEAERPRIAAGAGEKAAAEAAGRALWGPQRMPSDFDIECLDGRLLEIRALPSEQSLHKAMRPLASAYRRLIDRLRRWTTFRRAGSRQTVQLWLAEEDSRLLFWSLPKEISLLVLGD